MVKKSKFTFFVKSQNLERDECCKLGTTCKNNLFFPPVFKKLLAEEEKFFFLFCFLNNFKKS
jgi:hypothetical protein